MKNFLFLVVLLLATSFFLSCSEDTVENELSVSASEVKAGADAQVIKLVINSNTDWSAKVSANWCTITPSSGTAGQKEVVISFASNFSNAKRSASISFTAADKTAKIAVSQDKQLAINIPTKNYTIDYQGGTIAIASLTNIKYEATFAEASNWIAAQEISNTLKLTVASNFSNEDRIAKLILKEKNSTKTEEVLIIQTCKFSTDKLLEVRRLKIDGMECIKDLDQKAFYFPVDIDLASPILSHKIEFEGIGIDYLKIDGSEQKIYSGESFTFPHFTATTRISYKAYNNMIDLGQASLLHITGTPLISIVAAEDIVDEPKRPCDLTIIDPKGRTNTNMVYYKSFAGIEIRGAGSQNYPKKSFGFELRDKTTNLSVDGSLLGMREDADWILDAMWLDNAKMRNRVCFDLWNEFNVAHYIADEKKAETGTHGYLVEVFLNGRYHGMYMLSDKLDRKQLKLKKIGTKLGGYLYKTVGWSDECILQGKTSDYNNNWLTWNEVESDYPKTAGDINFQYYADLLEFVSKSSKEDFSANLAEKIDITSLVDYFIFTNLIVAYDNLGKNSFWGIYNASKSTKIFPLMWDMDGTLGRSWNAEKEDPNSGFTVQNRHNWKDFLLFKRIINENPANIHAAIKSRWATLKGGALNSGNAASKMDYYLRQQLESGASQREKAKWNTGYGDINAEVVYMKDWYNKRLAKMDALINGL